MKKLDPGQYAVLWFSSGDSESDGLVEEQAKKAGGQHLWLKTENKELATIYGVVEFPAVVVIDYKGDSNVLGGYQAIEEGIASFHLSPEQILMEKIETAVAEKGSDLRDYAVMDAAKYLSKMTISENTDSVYEEISKTVKTVKNSECKLNILKYLISVLAKPEFKSEKGPLCEELIQDAEKIETLRLRAETMAEMAVAFNDAGFKDIAADVIAKSIKEAQKLLNVDARVHALEVISLCIKKTGLTILL